MSLQYSYDTIKGSLKNLYFDYVPQKEQYSNIEHFTLPQEMKRDLVAQNIDQRFKSDLNVPIEIRNIIVPSEVISVVEKFDLDPSLLNTDEKNLRKKYLEFILTQTNDMYMRYKTDVINNLPNKQSLTPEQIILISQNADSLQMLTVRIIKLLIKELEPPVKCPKCPKCPECPKGKKEKFMNLSSEPHTLILWIIIIGVVYMIFKKNTI